MDSPFANNAPAGETGAATDDFWAFNPQQPPPVSGAGGDDTSLDELLALYQTSTDAPAAPFAPMGEPDNYPSFDAGAPSPFGESAPDAGMADFGGGLFDSGDPATDQPFPGFGDAGGDFGMADASPFGAAQALDGMPDFGAPGAFDNAFGADDAFPPMGAVADNSGLGAGGFDFSADASVPADPFGGLPESDPSPGFAFEADPALAAPDLADTMSAQPFGFDIGAAEEAPAFGFDAAPADDNAFGFDAVATPKETSFGFDAPAAGAEAPGFDFPATEQSSQIGEVAGFDFGAPTEGGFDLGGGEDPFAPLPGGPVFEAFDDSPPVAAAAAEEEDPFAPLPGGPVFEAFDDSPPVPAAAAVEEELMEFVPDESDAPMFMPIEDDGGMAFPAFDDTPPAAAAGAESTPFSFSIEPAAATPEPAPAAAIDFTEAFPIEAPPTGAVVPPTPPAATPATPAPHFTEVAAASAPSYPPGAPSALTGREVAVRTADERASAGQTAAQALAGLSGQLDQVQAKLAALYGDLQRAAVRRASVQEIAQITDELGRTRALIGEGSDAQKQALYLRQLADAYLQALQEL